MKYKKLVFIQNVYEDKTLGKIFDEGGTRELFDYLMDNYCTVFNEYEEWADKTNAGILDRVFFFGAYHLIVNWKMGYCGIEEVSE